METIELTQRVIESPKKFKDTLCTFNNYENHQYEDRLKRVEISKGKFKKSLYPIMMEIKKINLNTEDMDLFFRNLML